MVHRNLDRRVETLVLLRESDDLAHLDQLFNKAFDPGVSAWDMAPDSTWTRRTQDKKGQDLEDFQEWMIRSRSKR